MLKRDDRLAGVHTDLVSVVRRAAPLLDGKLDLLVLEGVRTLERQVQLHAAGLSQLTTTGRHLTGHAVDLGAVLPTVGLRWDWPLYDRIAAAMKQAAAEIGVALVWGGDWKSLKDGPHFELDRKVYPAPTAPTVRKGG